MTSVLKWMAQKVTNASNFAAESILRSIIIKFLEEPIQDDTISLQLFQDWTLKLLLKKTFVCVNLVNPYTPFLHFNSIYISKINLNAKYNLSGFLLDMERIVIDIDAKMPDKVEEPDPNLQASLIELKQQLPQEARKSNSVMDYILNSVKEIKIALDSFTTIVRVRTDLPSCSLKFEKISSEVYTPSSPEGNIKLLSFNFIVGEKRNQKNVANIQNSLVTMHSNEIKCTIDSISFDVDQELLNIFSVFLSYLPSRVQSHKKNTQTTQKADESSGFNMGVTLLIKTLQISMNGIKFVLNNFNLTISNGIKSSFDSIQLIHDNVQVFCLNYSEFQYLFATNKVKLATFADFPTTLVEALNYNPERKKGKYNSLIANLGKFSIDISKSFITSVIDIVQWINSFMKTIPDFQSSSPQKIQNSSSLVITAKIPSISINFENLGFFIGDASAQVMLASSGMLDNTRILSTIKTLKFYESEDYNIIETENFCQLALSINKSIGKDPVYFIGAKLGDFIVRIPGDMKFVFQIENFVKGLPISNETKPTDVVEAPKTKKSLQIDFRINSTFLEFITINIPTRMFISFDTLSVFMSAIDETMNFVIHSKISFYFTNSRKPIAKKYYTVPFRHQYAGVPYVGTLKTDIFVDILENNKIFVKIPDIRIEGGLCADLLSLLLAFFSHVSYLLDFPEEKQVKVSHFSPPEKLLEFQNTVSFSLMQSLKLKQFPQPGNFDLQKLKEKSVIYETIEKMKSSINEKIEPELSESYDDLPDVEITYEKVTTEPNIVIEIEKGFIQFFLYGGRDFDGVYDLMPLKKMPEFLEDFENEKSDTDFDIIELRDETKSVELISNIDKSKIEVYDKDPLYNTCISIVLSSLSILDHIPKSDSAFILSCSTEQDEKMVFDFNILKSEGPRMNVTFSMSPFSNMICFLTQSQIEFLVDCFSSNRPQFPCETIDVEPIAFQLFEIKGFNLLAFAHFTFYVNVHIDDVNLHVPDCKVLSVLSTHLASSLAEFYLRELARPGCAAVASGLPVVKSIRNVATALSTIFDMKNGQFGAVGGIAIGVAVLMRVLAHEALNAGAGAANLAQAVLQASLDVVDGKENAKEATQNGIASLFVEGKGIKNLPTLILAPGVLTMQKLSEILKQLRDKVSNVNSRRNDFYKRKK
ncbi:hypothetical protein TVAG_227680 [Trichomonas vaginalis G3]|uniref:Uncharacterized protein n=1 Tax=Trichomonas vaginalis (strain ATCC PRA-98 / G3) TaxID=412133 RepID=A2ERS0_TRIV3|nr:hypothetical protein TVAGG3_0182870 [Trichomonas vaginalis G3]EAY04651.1 hypothetical protein TVAG_227680 [Trichomonas vaginalis G3]KAI5549425.1 hypothetical protein TVAGG3_0182870 [Trichomonas vaginalis G3]|eukprot:XP_001316874.1 hypothetical protein [Trichomonas vaginalis G3]